MLGILRRLFFKNVVLFNRRVSQEFSEIRTVDFKLGRKMIGNSSIMLWRKRSDASNDKI